MKLLVRNLCRVICFCCVFHTSVRAQVKSYVPPGPNAASLGIYGQIPVSEYSGVPDITMPLYTITTSDFTMPVSVSYHGGGFHYSDEASWVGLGWSLNIGGVITRSKRQLDDFASNGYFNVTGTRVCSEDVDQEPDIFYYNFNGHAGKLILDMGTGGAPFTIRTFTQENIKFEYNITSATWSLTTQDGVKYIYGKTEMTTEHTVSSTGDGHDKDKTETYISSWYISSIVLPDNSKIIYTYVDPVNTKVARYLSSSVTSSYVSSYPPELGSGCCMPGAVDVSNTGGYTHTSVITDDVVLSQVDYPTGKIVLTTSNRTDLKVADGLPPGKKLDKIDFYTKLSGTDVYLKSYQFGYDYFSSGSAAVPAISTRLRLLNLTEKTQTATAKPTSFYYISDHVEDKSSSGNYMGSEGIIQSIVFPTGGSTHFLFEAHVVSPNVYNTPFGLRIKQIYSMDPANKLDVRNFEYTGGKAMGKQLEFFSTLLPYTYSLPAGSCCWYQNYITGIVNRRFVVSGNYSSLSETVNGYSVGYDKVVTYFGENGENGKKETFFENTAPTDPNYSSGIFPVPVPLNVSNKNGYPDDEYTYSNVGGTYVLLNRVHTDYSSANASTLHAKRFAFDKCNDFPYDITTEWIRKSAETNYNYDQTGLNPVILATQYYYDQAGNCLPTRIVTTDSRNNTMQTTNHYVQEKAASLGGVYSTMVDKNMIGDVIDEDYLKNTVLLTKKSTTYKDWQGNGRVIKPDQHFIQKGAGTPELDLRYNDYLENGKVASFSNSGGKPVSYIWGYDNTYPVAEISNALLQPKNELLPRSKVDGQFVDFSASSHTIECTPFYNNVSQTITYSVKITLTGTNPSCQFVVMLKNGNGNIVHSTNYYSANTFNETYTLPAGVDSFHFSVNWIVSNATIARFDIKTNYSEARVHRSAFHTSFEELLTGFQTDSKTGTKSIIGPFNVPMPYTTGNYILSWWEKPVSSGAWTYHEQPVTISTTNAADYVLGSTSVLLDEVRLYPADAFMTTYTYKPGVGMLSKCDERNVVTYYEYDDLLRLKLIRDEDKNILKTMDYNYKNY